VSHSYSVGSSSDVGYLLVPGLGLVLGRRVRIRVLGFRDRVGV